MQYDFPLRKLGNKICVIGVSSSGKSTLADKLGKKLNIPVTHLDQIAHEPGTNWQRRSDEYLIEQHNKVLQQPSWIIDGNYSVCMNERLKQATGIIWLDESAISASFRYIRRCLHKNPQRVGRLSEAESEFRWFMLKHILFTYPKNRKKYEKILVQHDLPMIRISRFSTLKKYYDDWQLENNNA